MKLFILFILLLVATLLFAYIVHSQQQRAIPSFASKQNILPTIQIQSPLAGQSATQVTP